MTYNSRINHTPDTNQHNLTVFFFISILSIFLWVSCGVCQDQTLRLGATIPLSGPFASYGLVIKDGLTLAKIDLEERGHTIELFYEDVPLPGPSAVTAIRKLIHVHKIHALAANFLNPAIQAMAPDIQRNKIISFHTAAADDGILSAGNYIFTTNARIRDEAVRMAEHAYHKKGARRAAVLYILTSFGESYATHFSDHFKTLGGEITFIESSMIGDRDLRSILLKAKQTKPDVLFTGYFGTNMGLTVKQAKEVGIKVPILGVYETEDQSVLDVAGESANGVEFFVPEPESEYRYRRNFRERFLNRFGYEPTILASNAYDAAILITEKFLGCSLEAVCVQKDLFQLKNYYGASGIITIGPDGASTKEFVLKKVEDNHFRKGV